MIALDNQHFLIGESFVTRGHFPWHFPRPYREPPFEEWSTTARHCHHSCLQVPSWENGGPEFRCYQRWLDGEIPKRNKSFTGKIIHKWWIFHCHVWASGWGNRTSVLLFSFGVLSCGGDFGGGVITFCRLYIIVFKRSGWYALTLCLHFPHALDATL